MAKSHFRVIVTIQIHSVWLAHKVNGYSDSMWELLVGLNGKLRIGQNSNRQLRKCMIFYWWLTSADIYENGLKLKVHASDLCTFLPVWRSKRYIIWGRESILYSLFVSPATLHWMLDCRTSDVLYCRVITAFTFSFKHRERKNKCCALVVDFHDLLLWGIV